MRRRPRGRGDFLEELIDIGRSLSGERTLDGLLHRILLQARRVTSAEAGALLLPAGDRLRFAAVQNDAPLTPGASAPSPRIGDTLPLDHTSVAGHVALTGEPVNIPDVAAPPATNPFPRAALADDGAGFRARSVLAVPLKDPSGELLGVLELANAKTGGEPVAFTRTDDELVRFLASYAAVLLRNAHLYERSEARAEKLAALAKLTRLLRATRDPAELFYEISRAATAVLGAKAARLWIDDPGTQALRIQPGFGLDLEMERLLAEYPSLPYSYGVVGEVFRARTSIYIEDVFDDPRWVNRRFAGAAGVHGFAAVPLTTADRTLGVLTVFFGERRRFTAEDKEVLALLAGHAALVVETAQLYRAQERRAVRLEMLTELNQLISSSLSTTEVLGTLARATAEMMDAAYAWIWIADRTAAVLHRVAVSDERFARAYTVDRLRFDEGLAGWVAEHGGSAIAADIDADERIVQPALLRRLGIRSLLAWPIGVGGEFLGVLNVGDREPIRLDADQRQLLDSLVAQAAIALRNARLYEDLRFTHEELARTQTQVIHTEKLAALGQFVAGVAHELNNPLTALLANAYLATRATDLGRLKEHVSKIQASGERAANIVRNLLHFARKSVPGDEPVDVNAVIERVLEVGVDAAAARRIGVVRDLAPDLPTTVGNPGELHQVLLNLVTNAVQAMGERGGTLTLRTRASDDKIVVAVSDTGPGIPPEIRFKIFDPFFTTKPMGTGTGLGLSVAAGIVTAHGGRLWLDEAVTSGTTFLIELPVRRAAPVPSRGPEPVVPPGRRILVVEDEPPVAEVLAALLRDLGCEVVVATSAKAARDAAAREPFDLISLDLIMPDESGADFWKELQATRPDLAAKVAFVSGAGERALLDFVERTGRPILTKPFTLEKLRAFLAAELPP
jgi:signal transduction histidine kinase/CheY-like chemotaxis protein